MTERDLLSICERLFTMAFVGLSLLVGYRLGESFEIAVVQVVVFLGAAFLFFALSGFVFQWLGWLIRRIRKLRAATE